MVKRQKCLKDRGKVLAAMSKSNQSTGHQSMLHFPAPLFRGHGSGIEVGVDRGAEIFVQRNLSEGFVLGEQHGG